jgi:dipeptidyl aminopeptidase/acylaminoacyl peptidase
VLKEVQLRLTNAEIAERLGLSPNTVKYHVANILAKLELSSREELAAWNPAAAPVKPRSWVLKAAIGAAAAGAAALGLAAVIAGINFAGGDDDATPAPVAATLPAGPPAGRIVFEARGDDGSSRITVIDADGTNEVTLADGGDRLLLAPAWSPDSDTVAYLAVGVAALPLRVDASSVAALWLVDGRGGASRQIADYLSLQPEPGVLPKPAWRPDGELLLFTTQDFIASIVNADGTGRQDELLGCTTSSWSPSGKLGLCGNLFYGLTVGPLATGFRWPETRIAGRAPDPTYPTRHIRRPAVQPVMSRDERWIAWWGYEPGELPHVYAAPLGPSLETAAADIRDLGPGQGPSFAPDRSALLFSTTTDLSFPPKLSRGEVVTYDLATQRRTEITNSGGANCWPEWSPDGRFIAFVSDRDDARGEIYVVNADGSAPRRITSNREAESMLDWGR